VPVRRRRRPPVASPPRTPGEAQAQAQTAEIDEEPDYDEEDDLPPLEANGQEYRPTHGAYDAAS
jgi:hypothetical protein